MSKRRHKINPLADIVAKKIFSDHEITIDFIETFLGFRPQSVEILNGTIADLKRERKGFFSTTVDILALMEDQTQVIIEIQVAYQKNFIKRLWTYSCQHLVKDLPNVRKKVYKTHDMYEKIMPVYSIALVASRYFDDNRPIHSFIITDSHTGEVLEQPFGETGQYKKPFEMVIIELKKFRDSMLDDKQRLWLEFFSNRGFSQRPTPIIDKAEQLLDRNAMTKEEIDMIDQWNRNASNHFWEIHSGITRHEEAVREKALKEGIELGIEQGIEQGQLSMIGRMLQQGRSPMQIADFVGLDLSLVQKLTQQLS
ncbi:TPA: Rpn family recombination-promoting nuclease/putative transposase [Streptococcus suis]